MGEIRFARADKEIIEMLRKMTYLTPEIGHKPPDSDFASNPTACGAKTVRLFQCGLGVLLKLRVNRSSRPLETRTVRTNSYLRRLHNSCLDMNWLPLRLIPKRNGQLPDLMRIGR